MHQENFVLPYHEIFQTLQSIKLNFNSEKDLLQLDTDQIDHIIQQSIQYCFKISQDELIPFSQKAQSQYQPDGDKQSTDRVGINLNAQELMRLVGIEDFSIIDIIKPDQKRIRKILSQITKFIQFQQREYENYRFQLEQNNAQEIKNNQIAQELIALHGEQEKLKEQKLRELPIFNELKDTNQKNQTIISQLIKEKNEQIEKKTFKINHIEELNQQIKQILQNKQMIQNQILTFNTQIVKSPDKIIKKQDQLDSQLKQEIQNQENLEYEINKQIYVKEIISKLGKQIETDLIEKAKEHQNQHSKLKQIDENLEQAQKTNQSISKRALELNEALQQFNTQIQDIDLQIKNLTNIQLEEDKKAQSLENFNKETYQLNEEIENHKKQLSDLFEQRQQIKIQVQTDLISSNINQGNELIQKLEQNVKEYEQNLFKLYQNKK